MNEFTKYQRNVWKAEAVEDIANTIISYIRTLKADVQYYDGKLEERLDELKTYDDCDINKEADYQAVNTKKTIAQIEEKISLWEQLLKDVDKELMF